MTIMIDYRSVNDLAISLAEIRSRTEALNDQVTAFQPELLQTLKKLSQDFWKLRLAIEETMNSLDEENEQNVG